MVTADTAGGRLICMSTTSPSVPVERSGMKRVVSTLEIMGTSAERGQRRSWASMAAS